LVGADRRGIHGQRRRIGNWVDRDRDGRIHLCAVVGDGGVDEGGDAAEVGVRNVGDRSVRVDRDVAVQGRDFFVDVCPGDGVGAGVEGDTFAVLIQIERTIQRLVVDDGDLEAAVDGIPVCVGDDVFDGEYD